MDNSLFLIEFSCSGSFLNFPYYGIACWCDTDGHSLAAKFDSCGLHACTSSRALYALFVLAEVVVYYLLRRLEWPEKRKGYAEFSNIYFDWLTSIMTNKE